MVVEQDERQQALIVDDSEINRAILANMLHEKFEVLQASNGQEALSLLKQYGSSISIVLLDLIMPKMDGFAMLEKANQLHLTDGIPVIMISTVSQPAYIQHAYDLGVCDYINRPFDTSIVCHRIISTILTHKKQTKLLDLMTEEVTESEKNCKRIIDTFGKVFALFGGEMDSEPNTTRILTELLLNQLMRLTNRYPLTRQEICQIGAASLLHDFGKLAIDRGLLNKPSSLTAREFEAVEKHTIEGVKILNALQFNVSETLIQKAISICRWHHERYDGCGYPDGLTGDAIPIWAQAVGLADAYDALTSARTYRAAYPHSKAICMLVNGECGSFNPLLIKCLLTIEKSIPTLLRAKPISLRRNELRNAINEFVRQEDLAASNRALDLLEQESNKLRFFTDLSREITFEYISSPPALFFTAWSASQLGVEETIVMPHSDTRLTGILSSTAIDELAIALRNTTPDQPVIHRDFKVNMHGQERCQRIICKANWSKSEPPRYLGAIGKAITICESEMDLLPCASEITIDPLTGLPTHESVRQPVIQRLERYKQDTFALMLIDIDGFREINQRYSHEFGDELLRFVAEHLRNACNCGELCARMENDEFLIFAKCDEQVSSVAERFLNAVTCSLANTTISAHMGVALSSADVPDYDTLLIQGSRALSMAKNTDGKQGLLYDASTMKDIPPVLGTHE